MPRNNSAEKNSGTRGRNATQPSQIPHAGWWDILLRVKDQISQDNVSIVAAGVAFYAVLALFPALAAIVSLYGLFTEASDIQQQIASLSSFLPLDTQTLIQEQLTTISTSG